MDNWKKQFDRTDFADVMLWNRPIKNLKGKDLDGVKEFIQDEIIVKLLSEIIEELKETREDETVSKTCNRVIRYVHKYWLDN